MSDRRAMYLSEAILLLTVTTLLSIAEGEWLFLAVSLAATLLGWWTTIRRQRPLLGRFSGGACIVLAFGLLVFEYLWWVIPIVALSHFMILVCLCKFLQERSLRDDAQILILCLLLLVVAAIVSGNLLFPIALAIYLVVGLAALTRFHLYVERGRAVRRIRELNPLAQAGSDDPSEGRPRIRRLVMAAAATCIAVGVALFVLCPRVGAGMFGRIEARATGRALTAFTSSLNFNTLGPIHESDRAVMRVAVDREAGGSPDSSRPLYFRGTVLDQYSSDFSPGGSWEWRRLGGRGAGGRKLTIRKADPDGEVSLLPQLPSESPDRLLVLHFYLEPTEGNFLFTCYPAVELRFDGRADTEEVRKWVEDQVLQVHRIPAKGLRYTTRSPLDPSTAAEAIDNEVREEGAQPPEVLRPQPPLPQEASLLALIREAAGEPPPAGNTRQRKEFIRRIEAHLRSGRYQYTLEPPRVRYGSEPVGDFLLVHRRGHCEYFASAMALMCQLSGIPARVVAGYCGGEYNPVGPFYIVRQKHAHSWVEAYVPGEGWLSYDPTPSAEGQAGLQRSWLTGIMRYTDYLQFQWANLVVTYDAESRRELFRSFESWLTRPARNQNTVLGGIAAFARELFGWRLQLDWQERLIYWVFSLLVLTLAVLVGYVVAVLTFWGVRYIRGAISDRTPRRGPQAEFYDRYCRALRSLGLVRPDDQTPAEFAEEMAARHPGLEDAREVIAAYYEVVFGGRSLSAQRRLRVEQSIGRIAALDRAQLADRPAT